MKWSTYFFSQLSWELTSTTFRPRSFARWKMNSFFLEPEFTNRRVFPENSSVITHLWHASGPEKIRRLFIPIGVHSGYGHQVDAASVPEGAPHPRRELLDPPRRLVPPSPLCLVLGALR